MNWETVEDIEAARYRAVRAYHAAVYAMAQAIEWDRAVDLLPFGKATAAAARNMYEIDQGYRNRREKGCREQGGCGPAADCDLHV